MTTERDELHDAECAAREAESAAATREMIAAWDAADQEQARATFRATLGERIECCDCRRTGRRGDMTIVGPGQYLCETCVEAALRVVKRELQVSPEIAAIERTARQAGAQAYERERSNWWRNGYQDGLHGRGQWTSVPPTHLTAYKQGYVQGVSNRGVA